MATRTQARALAARLREQAYDDGYAKRPARSLAREYQVSYRRGVQARIEASR